MNITILEGAELQSFIAYLSAISDIHTLRIEQREDGFAYKINSGMWSSTIGRRADAGGY